MRTIGEFIKDVGGAIKGYGIRDAKTLIDVFGTHWSGLKPGHTGYVAACLNTMGNYFAKATFRLYQRKGEALTEIFDHPFLNVLENPNNFQVENELKHYMGEFFGVFGNFYALKVRGVSSKKLREFEILDPSVTKPVSSKKNWIEYYEHRVGGVAKKIPRDEVIHLKYLTAYSKLKGTPIISAIKDILDVDSYQMAYMKQFHKEGGFLGNTFSTTQQMTPANFEKAKKELQENYGGLEKSFKTALFDSGLKPIKAAYSIRDLELTQQRKLTMQEVMIAFRMPEILLGGSNETYNKATAQAAEFAYASTMVDPSLRYIDQVLTKHVQMEYGKQFVVKHDPVSPKDIEENLKYYKEMTAVGGMTINETRTLEDYEPFPYELCKVPLLNVGGAVIRLDTGEQLGAVPNNVGDKFIQALPADKNALMFLKQEKKWEIQSLIFSKGKFTREQAVKWAKEHDFKSSKVDETDESYRLRQNDPSKYDKFRTGEITDGVKAVYGELKKQMGNAEHDLHWKQVNRRISRDLKWFERQITEFFEGQRARILDTLKEKNMTLVETFYEMEDEMVILLNMIENGWMRFQDRGYLMSGAPGTSDFTGRRDQFLNYSRSINETTKKKITKRMRAGEDPQVIINELYDGFTDTRVPGIAETTAVSGFNAGLWLGYRSKGFTHKTWISQRDESVRDSHFIADGQRVKIDELFVVGLTQLMYPGDPIASAEELINCRCTLTADKGE
ncbi:MAG: phage portal protein [Alphaproteobacteria bacterium]|nr:phage portal protein [Alphaproteobacteria bacterium]